ncbi:hypothetical protein V2G26_019642 [Clonostachys chloroleuca]
MVSRFSREFCGFPSQTGIMELTPAPSVNQSSPVAFTSRTSRSTWIEESPSRSLTPQAPRLMLRIEVASTHLVLRRCPKQP